jgi:hypothetical protein
MVIDPAKNAARTAGVVLLIQFITGILINQVLVGPYTFAKDYLTVVGLHADQITIGMLLGIISAALSIGMAARLLPVFKKYNEVLAFAFLAFSVLDFVCIAADNSNIEALLAVSRQYNKEGAAAAGTVFTLAGTVAYEARLWTHLMTLLVACISLSVFYYLLFRYRLLPRWLSFWGLISTVLMAAAIVLMIFGKSENILLLVPLALNQLVLIIWLLVKGLRQHTVEAVTA